MINTYQSSSFWRIWLDETIWASKMWASLLCRCLLMDSARYVARQFLKGYLSLKNEYLSTNICQTAPTTAGQLFCIANNVEAQEKLQQEVDELAPDKNAPITAEMINNASYLKACVKEGFRCARRILVSISFLESFLHNYFNRFFPIGTEISRIPQSDVTIGNYRIPAGVNSFILYCSTNYYPLS